MSEPKRYYGKYEAFVRDTKDPLQIGRVKLEVPDVLGAVLTDWARPILPLPAASGVGFFVRVKPGAQVWAEFIAGNPNRPIWSGGWWPQGQLPKGATGDGANDPSASLKGSDSTLLPPKLSSGAVVEEPENPYAGSYGESFVIRTPSGFLFEVDETSGQERLNVVHPAGTFLEVHPNGRLVVKTAGGRYSLINGDDVEHVNAGKAVEVDGDRYEYAKGAFAEEVGKKKHTIAQDGIVLEDGVGNTITLDKTNGKIMIEAVGDLDLVANGTVKIDGLNVSIRGRHVLPIQGAPI